LVCTLALVVVMPWTEYFWHFDRFLHGGQDLELGLLTLLAVLCLTLLLFQHGKKNLQLCLNLRHWLTHIFRSEHAMTLPRSPSGLMAPYHAVPLPSPVLAKYSLPLQV
jgi:hypothetical protein